MIGRVAIRPHEERRGDTGIEARHRRPKLVDLAKGVRSATRFFAHQYAEMVRLHRVGKIDGVRSLTNEIQVLPLSRFDDELRVRVAQAIYNHPAFWQYASMATPPIHIIVENGHITLTGRVNSQVEKSLAFAVAHVPGSFDVRNDLKIDR